MRLDKSVEHSVEITALSHEGRGIGKIGEKTIFVQGALAGETVVCQMTKKHRRYFEGKVIKVQVPADLRIAAGCQHFDICGGCSLQHMDFKAQVVFKQNTLIEQLWHFGRVTAEEVLPPLEGPLWGYRRKARLGVRFVEKKNKLLVGFREKASHYLADIQSCRVLHPSVGERIDLLAETIGQLEQFRHIAQVEVAVGEDATALVIRHLGPLPSEDQKKLIEFGEKYQFQIYLQPDPPEKISKIWPQEGAERLYYELPDFNLRLGFYPLDFTQVNGEVNRLMVAQALQLLTITPTENVLDLFCGLGNFTLSMARFAKKVCGIEGSQDMVDRAMENAALNQLTNTSFFAANLMSPPVDANWMNGPYDKILLDPPRLGAKEILPYIPKWGAKKILYVSCNPATLARDAGTLVHQYGYSLKKIGVINMFPHTSHIEAMALFE